MAAPSELELLQEAFYNFDDDKDFWIQAEHLKELVTREGEPLNDVEEFMQEALQFSDGNGNIDYRSFAQCMLTNEDDE